MTIYIRLYVTFLSEKPRPGTIALPYTSPQKEFSILHATPREIFSVIDLFKRERNNGSHEYARERIRFSNNDPELEYHFESFKVTG